MPKPITKKIISFISASCLLLLGSACAPNKDQLKKAIEEDPSIVFVAIEKAPEKFIEVVNKAARDAQMKGAEKAAADEKKKRDEEFANPLKPEIDEARAFKGPKDAKVTIVEYSDFECPFCSRGYNTIKEVLSAYPNQVRVLFKHLPLDFHPNALPASKAFEAIALQGHDKAYKFHDIVFENQGELKSKGMAFIKDAAKRAGADVKKMEKDMADSKIADRINADMEEAKKFGISGTPGFLINGVSLKGAYPAEEFKEIIDKHLASAK